MTGLEWLGEKFGAAALDAVVKTLRRKELGRELVHRLGVYEDIKLRWIERLLLRRQIRRPETWPLLLDTRSTTRQLLADAVDHDVLIRSRRSTTRARTIASALQSEVLGALETEDAFVALGLQLRWAAHDIRTLLDRTRPRDPDPALDAFAPLVEFYAPTLAPGRRFDHRAGIVGRQAELDALTAALTTAADTRLVVLTAPAGVGKSRLVLEALRRLSIPEDKDPRVMVRVESRVLDDDAFARLPQGPLILLVEDAHRDADGLAAVLQYARRRSDVRVLVTARGAAAPVLTAATHAHFDTREIVTLTLGALSPSEARHLVQELQADDVLLTAAGAERLAREARHAPVIAVLAISMIRSGELTAALTLDPDIRRHVMSTYGQVTTAGLPDVPPERARSTIAVIAALGTVNLDDGTEVDTAAAFLGTDRLGLLTDLGHLIDAGTVVRRKEHVRVVPDVLGDEVLATQAVAVGTDTGFVSRLWRAFAATRSEDLVRNLAELDWRLAALAEHDGSASRPDLFAPIWAQIRPAVIDAGNAGRYTALGRLRSVAATQPRRVLDLVSELLDRPATAPERRTFAVHDHADVRRAAAPLLRTVGAAAPELLPEVLDRLWQLAQLDTRPPNQDSDHPARLLEDIADLGSNDAATTQACLEAVERWLASPDPPDSPRTPITVLRPLVAKSGYTMDPGHRSIEMHPYDIAPDKVRGLRDQVRSLLERVAAAGSPRRAADAVDVLSEALREPVGYFGRSISEDVALAWEDDDLATVAVLQRIADAATEPLIRLTMRPQLDWLGRHARSPLLRQAGAALATSVDDHLEDLFTDVLRGGWSTLTRRGARAGVSGLPRSPAGDIAPDLPDLDADADSDADMAAARQELELRDRCQRAELALVVSNLTGRGLADALGMVAERVGVLRQITPHEPYGVEELIRELATAMPEEIAAVLGSLSKSEASALDPWARALLDVLADADSEAFVAALPDLMAGRTELAVAVLTGFAQHRWAARVPGTAPVLVAALDHPDPAIQAAAWAAAADLLDADLLTWAPRLAEAAAQHPSEVAAAVANAVRRIGPGWPSGLSTAGQSALLALLAALPTWDYPAHQLLVALAGALPEPVLRLLGERGLSASEQATGIRGLAQAISGHPQELRAWLRKAATEPEERQFDLAVLWASIAGRPLTDGARSVATDVATNGTDAEVDFLAGGIARDDGFAVREVALTGRLIDRISACPEPLRDRALAGLRISVHPTSYSRRPGHPSEDRERRRDQARAAAEDPGLSERARAFYSEAAASQQRLIDEDLRRDADEDD